VYGNLENIWKERNQHAALKAMAVGEKVVSPQKNAVLHSLDQFPGGNSYISPRSWRRKKFDVIMSSRK
jgi:hypothetical protein